MKAADKRHNFHTFSKGDIVMKKSIFTGSTILIIILLVMGTPLHQGHCMDEHEHIVVKMDEDMLAHNNTNFDNKSTNSEHNPYGNKKKTLDNSQIVKESDMPEIIIRLRDSAVQGNVEAQFILANWYQRIIDDKTEALKWYRSAAVQGHVEAQYIMGLFCEEGLGMPTDMKEAIKWYRMAAEQGHAGAQCNLGICYNNGEQGFPKDEEEASKWFHMAAGQGHAIAQYNLGIKCLFKDSLKDTQKEAVRWFRLAAEQGNERAQGFLGGCYELGVGVTRDDIEAAKWYLKAQMQGINPDSIKLILKHILEIHQDSKKE